MCFHLKKLFDLDDDTQLVYKNYCDIAYSELLL